MSINRLMLLTLLLSVWLGNPVWESGSNQEPLAPTQTQDGSSIDPTVYCCVVGLSCCPKPGGQ